MQVVPDPNILQDAAMDANELDVDGKNANNNGWTILLSRTLVTNVMITILMEIMLMTLEATMRLPLYCLEIVITIATVLEVGMLVERGVGRGVGNDEGIMSMMTK